MKGSLSAAGGTLLIAAALFATAGAANADDWDDWNRHYPDHCSLGTNDDSVYQHVTEHGVFAGIRDADACKHDDRHHDRWGRDDKDDDDRWGRSGRDGWDGDDRWGRDDFGGRF